MKINQKTKKMIDGIMDKIKKHEAVIATERDELRKIYDDLKDILESLDEGIDSMENGLKDIETGIDAISQYL